MALAIAYLFVPGNRPDGFDKALGSGADDIILDLEDAVDTAGKDAARTAIGAWLDSDHRPSGHVLVRINDDTIPRFADDLELLRRVQPVGAVLPKSEQAEQIARVAEALGPSGIVVPLIETARGLRAVDEVAATDRTQRLTFGTLDFAVDLDLSGDERGLIYPVMTIALASRCAERAPPIAGVTSAIDDDGALSRDLAFARAVGFTARLWVRRVPVPSEGEIDRARRVLGAAEGSAGVIHLDGRMVARPALFKMKSILERAHA